jgi:periplasmic protein TonB
MAGIDLLADKWTDIVFENKNKAYGAYDLRKRYNRLSIIAVFSAIALFGFFITAPMVLRLITGALEEQELKISEEITLENPPPIDQNEPPPPPPEIPPPPIKTTVQFTPPVVVDTEDVPEDPPPAC